MTDTKERRGHMKRIIWSILIVGCLVACNNSSISDDHRSNDSEISNNSGSSDDSINSSNEDIAETTTSSVSDLGYGEPVHNEHKNDYSVAFFKKDTDLDYDYDSFVIYDESYEVVFESDKQLNEFYGLRHKDLGLMVDEIKSDTQLLYVFKRRPSASSYGQTLILCDSGEGFEVVFMEESDISEWSDYNKDGYLDFFAYTLTGGQTSLDEGFGEVFIFDDNASYISSKYFTREFYANEVEVKKDLWNQDPSYRNFDDLCHAMALNGEVDPLTILLEENKEMYSHLDENDADVFLTNYALKGEMLAEEYQARWTTYNQQVTESPMLVPKEHRQLYNQIVSMDVMDIDGLLDLFNVEFETVGYTFLNEHISGDIFITENLLDEGYPFYMRIGGILNGFKVFLGKPIIVDVDDIKRIMVYSIRGTDYLSLYDKNNQLKANYHVQGIVYSSIELNMVDEVQIITFDRIFRDGTKMNTTLKFKDGRL